MPSTQIDPLASSTAPVQSLDPASDSPEINAYAHAANLILDRVLAHLSAIQTRFRLSDEQAYQVLKTALNDHFQQIQ